MEFLKSWKFAMIIFAALCAAAIGGVIYGVVTHEEAGFIYDESPWSPEDYPIGVCVASYDLGVDHRPHTDDLVHADAVMDLMNDRLGFFAFRNAGAGSECRIQVIYNIPVGPGEGDGVQVDPGGYAIVGQGGCNVGISNVTGEMKSLTLQHELGHCLGLAHDDFESSIMRPVQSLTPAGSYPPRITDFDRDLINRSRTQ